MESNLKTSLGALVLGGLVSTGYVLFSRYAVMLQSYECRLKPIRSSGDANCPILSNLHERSALYETQGKSAMILLCIRDILTGVHRQVAMILYAGIFANGESYRHTDNL